MSDHPVVSSEEWLIARKELLQKEKELSRLRDELTQQRRDLPWQKVEKDYVFDGADGKVKLLDLFGASSQLLVYHFMFGPDWKDGCKVCSMVADHYGPLIVHLKARDVTLVTVSRAPIEKLTSYKQRMGWEFEWASSINNDFNRDFGVSFTQEEMDESRMNYNYEFGRFPSTECPGISCFVRNPQGEIFHTYSAYARGLENLLGIYNYLDLVPKGRDEAELPYGMAWVRPHDGYDDDSFVDPYL
jgi:predicted dithiol-disulfide oxidoreductase (DUF899 family)